MFIKKRIHKKVCVYIYIYIYIYIYKWSYVIHNSAQSHRSKMSIIYVVMKTMHPPGYRHKGFAATHANVHHVPKCMGCPTFYLTLRLFLFSKTLFYISVYFRNLTYSISTTFYKVYKYIKISQTERN